MKNKKRKQKRSIVNRDPNAKALSERTGSGRGCHKNKQAFYTGHARQPKHKNKKHECSDEQ